jgi:adenosylcobinamide-GDP ribazoletransferase
MMGLVAVVLGLLVKLAGIWCVKTGSDPVSAALVLLIVPAYARASMIVGIWFLPYGRKTRGTGKDLFQQRLKAAEFTWCLIPLALSLFLGYKGLALNILFVLGTVGILRFYQKTMGCITGDMLGAMNEVMEALLFLGAGALIF